MNIDMISTVLCNLDINKYEEVGNGLLPSEQMQITKYWKIHTKYEVDENTTRKYWSRNGRLHRDGDLPAVEYGNGSKEWWRNGKQHRDGVLPAVKCANGTKEWWRNGVRYHPS